MLYKEDWDKAKERFGAWWRGELIDRVCIQVCAPIGPASCPPAPSDHEVKWTSVDYAIDCAEQRIKNTYYGGEAFPSYYPNLGPDVFSAYHGSRMLFENSTTWVEPCIDDWENDPGKISFDSQNRLWKLTEEMTVEAVKRSRGNYIVGLTAIILSASSLEPAVVYTIIPSGSKQSSNSSSWSGST